MAVTPAQQEILRSLRDGPQQAQELAATLEIDVSAAYRHLEALREAGFTKAQNTIGGPGRPKKMYALTPSGWEAFPRDYAYLLTALMGEIRDRDGPDKLQGLMDQIAQTIAAPIETDLSRDERLRRLVRLYNKLGFEAKVRKKGDAVVLEQRNCPFLKAARDDPEALCQCLDEGIIRTVLPEAEVSLEATLAKGDPRCRHEIVLGRKRKRA